MKPTGVEIEQKYWLPEGAGTLIDGVTPEHIEQGYVPLHQASRYLIFGVDLLRLTCGPQESWTLEEEYRWVPEVLAGTRPGEIRVRSYDGIRFELTVKGKGHLKRPEWKQFFSLESFTEIWPATEGQRIDKRRYSVPFEAPFGGVILEIDVYSGLLQGITTLEAEFETEEQAEQFEPPAEVKAINVTKQKRWKNAAMAERRPDGA